MFAYCGNNPTIREDCSGCLWDYIIDWIFILWSIYDVVEDPTVKNWICLAIDALFAVIPFVPSGAGQIIKVINVSSDWAKTLEKVTVIGETMDRVKDFAQKVGALDNLYDGFKWYKELADTGALGKVLAEIGGKFSNGTWLFNKLRQGYTIYDIGIDVNRAIRSSSYALEQVITFLWNTRNIWKAAIHEALKE